MPAQGRGANLAPSDVAKKAPPKKVAPQKAPSKAPSVFSEPLSVTTQRNYRTGGLFEQRAAQEGQKALARAQQQYKTGTDVQKMVAASKLMAAGKLKPEAHHSIFNKALKALGAGAHDVEGGIAKALDVLHVRPSYAGGAPIVPGNDREANQKAAQVIMQAAETAGIGAAGKGLKVAGGALRATEGSSLASTAGRTVGSAALRGAGAGTSGYAKLMLAATPARAAAGGAERPMSPNEPFASHFWKSAVETIANLPAGAIEGVKHPIKTAEGLLSLYEHPKKAFHENPFGTILAFLGPARAADRLGGSVIRGASRGRVLSTERPALQARPGIISPREWDKGLIGGSAQRIPDRAMKAVGKGEKPLPANLGKREGRGAHSPNEIPLYDAGSHPSEPYTPKALTKANQEAVAQIKRVQGKPDGTVHVWRVAQSGGLKSGDWVSLSKAYAEQFQRNKGGVIHEEDIPARDLKLGAHTGLSEAGYHPPQRDIVQATKRQTKKMVGGGTAAVIRPSHVDMLEGGRKLAHNLETMKRRDFLARQLGVPFREKLRSPGKEGLRAQALMVFHEGVARTPQTFWPDVAERIAQLKEVQRGQMHPEDRRLSEAQVKNLEALEQNKGKLDSAVLTDAAEAAGHTARYQVEDWKLLNREGVGLPGQLAARFVPPLLTHGHLMGRGELKFNEQPGPHPLTERIHELEKAREQTKKDIGVLRAELRGRVVPAGVKQGHHFRKEAAEDQLKEHTQQLKDLNEQLTTAKATGQADHRGNLYPGVYDEAGKRISAAEAEKFIQEHYGREIGFLTHRQERVAAQQGPGFGNRTTYPMRTGGHFLTGAYDNSPNALREHFDRVAHNLSEKRSARQVASQLVMGKGTDEHGQTVWYDNQHEAEQAAKAFNASPEGAALADHLGQLKAFNVGPKKVADLIDPHHTLLSQAGQIEGLALSEEHGNWGVVPADVADRFKTWEKTEDKIRNSHLKLLTTPWRRTNLYTSTRWPIGVTQENAIRLAAVHASPLVVLPYLKNTSLSWLTGNKVTGYLDRMIQDPHVPQEQKDLAVFHRSMLGQGGFMGAQLRNSLEGMETIFQKGSDAERRLQAVPGQRAAAHVWNGWTHWVGNSLAKMEQNSKEAAAGKLAKADQTFYQRWRDLSGEQAARNYAHKLTNDPIASIHAAQKLIEVMGNYTHLTPTTRAAQATWAPFSLWWLNSARFIFKTMPKDHPYATSLLTAMVYATHSENRPLKRYLDGSVALDLPLLGKIRLTSPLYYSPYGIAEQPANTAAEMVLPQAFEPLAQFKGIDPLTNKKYEQYGEGQEGIGPAHAAFGALGNFVPGARIAESLLRQGGHEGPHTVFPWESTDKVSILRALAKTFLPVKYQEERAATTKAKKKAAKAAKSEWDISGGGGGGSEWDISK